MRLEMEMARMPNKVELREYLYKRLNSPLLMIALYAMMLSYFYNLPVMKYSAIGNNELRLYDLAGVVLVYIYFRNIGLVNEYIRSNKIFYSLYVFLCWCCITLIFTGISSILADRFLYIVQSMLYLFHFWSFFLNAVFLSIIFQDLPKMKRMITVAMVASIITFLIVILQNFGMVPFLWNDTYLEAYQGFLSGTLGPNKIVLGMTCLFMFALAIGLLNESRVKFNKILLLTVIGFAALVIILSGSRTSYVGIIVFLAYFSVKETISFIYSAVALFFIMVGISAFNPQILDKASEVYKGRVEDKMDDPEELKDAKVNDLYEDLGAGRKEIFVLYLELLANDYYYIPFGRGFNNRLQTFSSAHNTYLSLIYEVGILGMVLYFRWLILYLFIRMGQFSKLQMALQGLVISMLVTLFFGEHLYIYRPLFGLAGLFLFVTTILASPIFVLSYEESKAT